MVVHTYDIRYTRGILRRIVVLGQLWAKNMRPYLKIKAKNLWYVAQVLEYLHSKQARGPKCKSQYPSEGGW
jgi:hypothetical protein